MDMSLGHTRALIDECRRQGLLRNRYPVRSAITFKGNSSWI
jgi:hypothetical protein